MKLNQDSSGFLVGNKVEVAKINILLSSIDGKVGMIYKLLAAAKSAKVSNTTTINQRSKKQNAQKDIASAPARKKNINHGDRSTSKSKSTIQSISPTPAFTPQKESANRDRAASTKSTTELKQKKILETKAPAREPAREKKAITEQQDEAVISSNAKPKRSKVKQESADQGDTITPSPTNPNRDSKGRFIKKAQQGDDDSELEKSKTSSAISTIAKWFKGVTGKLVAGSGSIEEMDPTVKAINELTRPLSAGYSAIFGEKESGEEKWLKRLYKSVLGNRAKEKKEAKEQQQTLDDILDVNRADSKGFLGNILSVIVPVVAFIASLFGKFKLPFGGNGGGAEGGNDEKESLSDRLTRAAEEGGDSRDQGNDDRNNRGNSGQGSGDQSNRGNNGQNNQERQRRAGNAAKKSGSIIAAITGIFNAFSDISEINDKEGDQDSKNIEIGKMLGSLGGTLAGGVVGAQAGAAIGTMIFPVVGTAIGSLIGGAAGSYFGDTAGEVVGEKAGEFFNSLDGATLSEKIVNSFTLISDTISSFLSKTGDKISNAWSSTKDTVAINFSNFTSGVSKAFNHVTGKEAKKNKETLENQMNADGITDPKERALFLAQMDHESGGFDDMEESFNYSAGRLMSVSQTARSKGIGAVLAAQRQGAPAVAELMYGGRMGNTEQGDAYKYRGRGFTQLTGKEMYSNASKDLGIDLINNPDLAAKPEIAAKIATWHWKKSGAQQAAQAGDVGKVGRIINGGNIGAADRISKTSQYLAQASMPVQTVSQSAITADSASVASVAPSVTQVKPPATAEIAAKTTTIPSVAPIKLSYNQGQQSSTTSDFDISRDISDRSIAHIVTGGYAPKP